MQETVLSHLKRGFMFKASVRMVASLDKKLSDVWEGIY